jgi:hypothetical protein
MVKAVSRPILNDSWTIRSKALRRAVSLLVLALVQGAAQGAPTDDSDLKKRAQCLVAQLGDKDYRERERAAKELLDVGFVARDAVFAGRSNPDGEISERCRKLYPAIWRHELGKRVQKFLDNPQAPIADDLPGASRWLKIAGVSEESRRLRIRPVRSCMCSTRDAGGTSTRFVSAGHLVVSV